MLTMSFICEQKEKSLRNLRTFIIIYRPPDKSVQLKNYFSYSSTKTYVVGTQKNRLDETENRLDETVLRTFIIIYRPPDKSA